MTMFFFIAALLVMLGVVATMAVGIYAISRGGDFNKKYGNKLMRTRVGLQALALALLALAYFASKS
ncbi:MAG: twin transmembrane helix small protein [Alphaproteobacteria bacterium]|nr:twin transmembrane helix small protein [Alphaproteobacteria bacterium]